MLARSWSSPYDESMAAPALHIEGELAGDGGLRVPASAFDLEGFRTWLTSESFPPNVRASFVGGELFVEMSPEAIESHNKVKTAVTSGLSRLVEDEDLGELYSDRALLTHAAAGLSTEPDLIFASYATLEAGRLVLVPRAGRRGDYVELQGSPDLVVEIVSDSSVRKDTLDLRAIYARAEIPEYWLIDARGDELRFDVLVRSVEGRYEASAQSAVFGRALMLERWRNRVGRWRYRLDGV
jgi:Uma2 family endonuclease